MQVSITTRHFDADEAIKQYAADKVRKLQRYLAYLVSGRIILIQEGYRYIAEIALSARNMSIVGKESSTDMHSAIDLAVSNVQKQLGRFRDRVKEHKARRQSRKRL